MSDKKRVPKLRFPGFTEPWEQRKLGEVFEFQYGEFNNNPDNGGEYPIYGANGIIGGYTDWNAENSSIIGHMGAYAGYVVWGEGKHFVTYNGTIARPKDNSIDSKYGYYLLDSKKIYKICAGSGQPFVSYSDLNGIDILLPKDKDEQRLLAYYFTNLDHLITLHQRKLEHVKKMKKSMLQKMFPKKNQLYPEVRFPGFTDAWEQRKFSELYAKSSEKNDGSIGMDKNITVATMQFKEDVKVSTAEYLKTYYTFNLGDIAFEGHQSKEFRYGRFVENDIGNGIVSHIFAVFRPIREYDLYFWKYAINNETLMQRILSRSTKASTMMHDLVTKDFLNEMFLVPSFDEQRQIGVFLDTLDHLITLHQRELDHLQLLKKGMLQQMFI